MALEAPRDPEMMTSTIVDRRILDDSRFITKTVLLIDVVDVFLTKIWILGLCHRQIYVMTIVNDILKNDIEREADHHIVHLTQTNVELVMGMTKEIEVIMVTNMN
jgi:hypothetical protein